MSIRVSESIKQLLVAKKFYFDSLNPFAAPPGAPPGFPPGPAPTLVATLPITTGGVPGQLPLLTEKEAVLVRVRMFALNSAGESGFFEGGFTVRGPLAPPAGTGLPVYDGYGGFLSKVRVEGAIDGSGNLEINAYAVDVDLVGASGYVEILDVEYLKVS